jgi:hypothetical protein
MKAQENLLTQAEYVKVLHLSRAQLQEPMSVPARKCALQPLRQSVRQFGRIVRLRKQQVAVRRQDRRYRCRHRQGIYQSVGRTRSTIMVE